jgi:hypothetical protein
LKTPSSQSPSLRRVERIGIALVLLPLLALIAHGIWNYTIAHGLTARIAAIRASGEPICPGDTLDRCVFLDRQPRPAPAPAPAPQDAPAPDAPRPASHDGR